VTAGLVAWHTGRRVNASAPGQSSLRSASRWVAHLTAPVDVASLAAFRALFGGVLMFAALRYVYKGWVWTQLLAPPFHFTYPSLEFVRPWPGSFMYVHMAVLVCAGVGLTLGIGARLCAGILCLGFAYLELIDRATFLNHYYLICLMALLLTCVPSDGALSIASRLWPSCRVSSVPRYVLYTLRLQVGVVYVFAGLAKLNPDWLWHAQPLRIWLSARAHALPGVGPWLVLPWIACVASWLGAVFDLTVVPMLLLTVTRSYAFAAAGVFHALTGWLFPIGMFPWIMLSCATLFFAPDWPRRLLGDRAMNDECAVRAADPSTAYTPHPWLAGCFALHCCVQVLIPLHHHVCVRDSAWTNEGWDFAWKVMLAEKAGSVRLLMHDRSSGERWEVDPAHELHPYQLRALGQDARLIVQYARHVAAVARTRTGHEVAVYADAIATLNGRPAQRLIAEDVDLASDPLPKPAVLPLNPRPMK